MEANNLNVAICDDHPMLREGVKLMINQYDDSFNIKLFDSGKSLIDYSINDIDVVLLDLEMPGLSGHDVIRQLKDLDFKGKIIVFTIHDDYSNVIAALKAGADGYVIKSADVEEIVDAINIIQQGGNYFTHDLPVQIMSELNDNIEAPRKRELPLDILTDREREILKYIASNTPKKEISKHLGINTKTVDTHKANILRKLGFRNTLELMQYGLDEGIL